MNHKVLIVEDNLANRTLLRDVLLHYGFDTLEAVNGLEGIRMAREARPDVILMDLQMPVMNGYSAIEVLKADPVTRDMKIIAVTSFAMTGDREKVMATGADEYIAKPIDTRKLPEIIKNIISE
ncbi:MAG: response regulator [Spirochaetes bacterium]|nr:MAG: response regulator [Spirochaetota bacterium]